MSVGEWDGLRNVEDLVAPWESHERKERRSMSTIEEVRAAEKRVQKILDALKKADAQDPNHLSDELKKATDEYARVVRELNSK